MLSRRKETVFAMPAANTAAKGGDRVTDRAPRGKTMDAYVETIASPAGPVAFAVNDDGALLWVKFIEGQYARTIEDELAREGYRAAMDPQRTTRAREELSEYAAGARHTFEIPLVLVGSDWQKTVWRALTRIPFGETRTYGQVAAMIGHPNAARAVGRANATNRLPLVVPCHRVIGADGSLTGFAGGTHLKTRLLTHETTVRGMDPTMAPGQSGGTR